MPTLYILGGANGVGKTTWYNVNLSKGLIDEDLPFVNVDIIAQKELGSYTEENLYKAEAIAKTRIDRYVKNAESFMIESNLAKNADYDWIELLKRHGYGTLLFFLGTDDTRINKARVTNRIAHGGHFVPETIIEQRYKNGLSYLKSKILQFDEACLIDNSHPIPTLISYLRKGKIINESTHRPAWAESILFIPRKLHQKNLTSPEQSHRSS